MYNINLSLCETKQIIYNASRFRLSRIGVLQDKIDILRMSGSIEKAVDFFDNNKGRIFNILCP